MAAVYGDSRLRPKSNAGSLAIKAYRDGNRTLVLQLFGEFDLASVPVFEEEIASVGAENPLIIDLKGLGFIDSSGLSALLVAYERAMQDGREISFLNGSPKIARILRISGLDEIFRFAI
jgi:anti-sigma B factor antagonist